MTFDRELSEAAPSSTVDRRYRVKREIARGGMGVVHEADHVVLRRSVALKTLTRGALEWPLVHTRLVREARALSLVRHPGIANVLDAGSCPQHGPYIALEMIEGRSLESFIVARQRLDVEAVVHIAAQLGPALSFVHDRGIVHRDIKPGNVLVSRAAGQDSNVLKLLDFGIATVPGDDDVISRKLTQSGDIIGTVEYMAPEQLLDEAPPTFGTDVYAFGALLYECLAGDVPLAGTPREVMTALIAGRTPAALTELRSDVPPALAAAIMRALSRDPSARFPRADALARAVIAAVPQLTRPLALLEPIDESDPSTRRAYPRAPFVTPVRLVSSSGSNDGRTEDVSEGGLLLVIDAQVREGERVTARMPLPLSGRVVTVEAIARWARTRRGQKAIGLAFTSLPDDARDDIRGYVALMTGVPATPARPAARAA